MHAAPDRRSSSQQRVPSCERRGAHRAYREVVVGGLRTACVSREKLASLMVGDCLAARREPRTARLVFASNGHAIALAQKDAEFRRRMEAANLVHADGQPVVVASKLIAGAPIPERSATTDFIHDASHAAAEHGLRFYLLGSTEDVNRECAVVLEQRYPGLRVAGRRNGYFHIRDEWKICDAINESGADVLWVGLGVPFEYEFCVRNQHRLKVGWIVTCGGCFNFVAGDYARAPQWMQSIGLEWLYRVLREPRRLFWRYAVTNPIAAFALLTKTVHPQ
ncbi:MAG TPA: WecB/TagA/CpsF family glycosyltransferase [Rhizomicrobium sp.]|jgi:exopolysaccharide biosynthesis WecB/TagA/CpsF family protein